ncbi:hypothetical protein LYNGBM3L_45520 [Moorena producens 3L]|uniref:Uncharacterized protein n=1 Tax=Moorena producens 3L TaxID=489825 RepID=F4XWS7_9CYAN|nr:hypothetical protein LYNGBM3L_45520 [Moorena producens 3L]
MVLLEVLSAISFGLVGTLLFAQRACSAIGAYGETHRVEACATLLFAQHLK